ncbi:hypothetical protein Phum_PHUM501540 [Pediculus humanus corporis]|uniref:Uncharacterized protein n=1 Tax=Pediculus humanus subsp. corporis TaxID=121224 RepID=E0VXK2_PEDHC|nr:uncharacterized protein Phum_PHUM501540 [Pediculus humanus corporis]EEB18108.1 hypothetical protein Phum_PHUM501540 [Pediculus humanus corporis]
MGKIFKYVLLLSNLTLILGIQNYKEETHSPSDLDIKKPINVTYSSRVGHFFPKNGNDSLQRKEFFQQKRKNLHGLNTENKIKEPLKTLGLSAYEEKPHQRQSLRRKNFVQPYWKNEFRNPTRFREQKQKPKNFIPLHSQELFPTQGYRTPNNNSFNKGIQTGNKNFKPSFFKNVSHAHQLNEPQGSESHNVYQRHQQYGGGGRNPKFFNPKQNIKISCDACNSVPWVPLIKVPNSYRQERNQNFQKVHQKPNFNNAPANYQPSLSPPPPPSPVNSQSSYSSHNSQNSYNTPNAPNSYNAPHAPNSYATPNAPNSYNAPHAPDSYNAPHAPNLYNAPHAPDSYNAPHAPDSYNAPHAPNSYNSHNSHSNLLLSSSSPLVPPTPTILDGTISSSYGLPAGNIPTAHGMLAPLNPYAPQYHKYGDEIASYTDNLPLFASPNLVGSSPIPAINPIQMIPFYNSGPFYGGTLFETSDIGLVPPTVNPVSVSNVIFTISEGNSHNIIPNNLDNLNHDNTHLNSNENISFQQSSKVELVESLESNKISKETKSQVQKLKGIEIVKSVPVAEFSTSDNNIQQSVSVEKNVSQDLVHSQSNQNVVSNDPSSYLVPPPPIYFNKTESPFQEIYDFKKELESNNYHNSLETTTAPPKILGPSSWLFLNPPSAPKDDIKPHIPSIAAESQEIASIVNNEFHSVSPQPLPVSASDVQKPDNSQAKKIQIIIPYVRDNQELNKDFNKDFDKDLDTDYDKDLDKDDPNSLESVRHEVYETLQALSNKSEAEYAIRHEGAKPSSSYLDLYEKDQIDKGTENAETFNQKLLHEKGINKDKDSDKKYITEMQHILAKNIKELLSREIEKSETNQNFPLQNNIDNWTALEYSNHKTITNKEPQDIIAQALSVTSIPGVSLSHVLLPSKKIPEDYFSSTSPPLIEQSYKTHHKSSNFSVNSRPFTARPFTATLTSIFTSFGSEITTPQTPLSSVPSRNIKNQTSEDNYTISGKSRVNYWGKLNENGISPEVKNPYKNFVETTLSLQTSISPVYSRGTEKIEIVTPVSVTPRKTDSSKTIRTTRQIRTTERTIFRKPPPSWRQNFRTKSFFPRKNLTKTNDLKVSSTKLQEVSSLFFESKKISALASNSSDNLKKNQTITSTIGGKKNNIKKKVNSSSEVVGVKKFTTHSTLTIDTRKKNTTSDIISGNQLKKTTTTNTSEVLSINDIIPFRNKQLPWESNVNDSTSENIIRQRKSLIKQVNLRRPRHASFLSTTTNLFTDSKSDSVHANQNELHYAALESGLTIIYVGRN